MEDDRAAKAAHAKALASRTLTVYRNKVAHVGAYISKLPQMLAPQPNNTVLLNTRIASKTESEGGKRSWFDSECNTERGRLCQGTPQSSCKRYEYPFESTF